MEAYEVEEQMALAVRNTAPQAGLQAAKTLWLQHPLFAPAGEQPAVAARPGDLRDSCPAYRWSFPTRMTSS